jgi:hypothetical protein
MDWFYKWFAEQFLVSAVSFARRNFLASEPFFGLQGRRETETWVLSWSSAGACGFRATRADKAQGSLLGLSTPNGMLCPQKSRKLALSNGSWIFNTPPYAHLWEQIVSIKAQYKTEIELVNLSHSKFSARYSMLFLRDFRRDLGSDVECIILSFIQSHFSYCPMACLLHDFYCTTFFLNKNKKFIFCGDKKLYVDMTEKDQHKFCDPRKQRNILIETQYWDRK